MSTRGRMILGFALANGSLLLIATVLLLSRPAAAPSIHGILLADGRALPPFALLDHRDQVFSNADLVGRWHLVSYGFTSCPDVCPTTLSELAVLSRELDERDDDLQILFYSVDHRRDTPAQLASYLSYFDPRFLGLTYRDDDEVEAHLGFENGLGIRAKLLPVEPGEDSSPDEYQVLHGIKLFLLNPEGELQATFDPGVFTAGVSGFDATQVLQDYLAVRDYLD